MRAEEVRIKNNMLANPLRGLAASRRLYFLPLIINLEIWKSGNIPPCLYNSMKRAMMRLSIAMVDPFDEDPGDKRFEGGVSSAYLAQSWRYRDLQGREKGVCEVQALRGVGVSASLGLSLLSRSRNSISLVEDSKETRSHPRPSMNMINQTAIYSNAKSRKLSAEVAGDHARLCSFVQVQREG